MPIRFSLSILPVFARHPFTPVAARSDDTAVREVLCEGDDQSAVRLLMAEYGDGLYGFMVQMVGERALADDVYQTLWIQVLRDRGQYSGQGTVRSWLYSVARNRCLDALKSQRRRERRFRPTGEPPDVADENPDAVARLETRELSSSLEECLQSLDPKTRVPLLLRFFEGMSFKEIARICGEKPGTLQARVARALPLLRRCIESRGNE